MGHPIDLHHPIRTSRGTFHITVGHPTGPLMGHLHSMYTTLELHPMPYMSYGTPYGLSHGISQCMSYTPWECPRCVPWCPMEACGASHRIPWDVPREPTLSRGLEIYTRGIPRGSVGTRGISWHPAGYHGNPRRTKYMLPLIPVTGIPQIFPLILHGNSHGTSPANPRYSPIRILGCINGT